MDVSYWLTTGLTWIFVGVALLMVFLILLQEGKGGGLAALGGTKAAGVEGVTNPIRRATGYLAAIWFILAVILGLLARSSGTTTGSDLYDKATGIGKKAEPTEEDQLKNPTAIPHPLPVDSKGAPTLPVTPITPKVEPEVGGKSAEKTEGAAPAKPEDKGATIPAPAAEDKSGVKPNEKTEPKVEEKSDKAAPPAPTPAKAEEKKADAAPDPAPAPVPAPAGAPGK